MKKSIKELFGVGPDKIMIEVGEEHPLAPKRNGYRHRVDLLSPVLGWLLEPEGDSLWLSGPTGSGKTSLITDICAALNWPLLSATACGSMTARELIGHFTVVGGDMIYQHGPLALAMKHGFIFMLNEADLMAEDELARLNDVAEGRPLLIEENGGEIVEPHERFRFVVTANTNGRGDETGHYLGARAMNLAFMHRFQIVEVPYMDAKDELELMKGKFQDIPAEVLDGMVKVADEVRKRFQSDGEDNVGTTISTRILDRWARLTLRFRAKAKQNVSPVRYALDIALLNGATAADREAIHEIVNMVFGDNG